MKQEQVPLERPVCHDRQGVHVCCLLSGHSGRHTSSQGRQWS